MPYCADQPNQAWKARWTKYCTSFYKYRVNKYTHYIAKQRASVH